MSYKVIITARSFGKTDELALEVLRAAGCEWMKLEEKNGSLAEQLKKELPTADALIAGVEPIGADLIKAAPKLKVISRYGVGYDNVDIETAAERGIQVTITPDANKDSVADLAVALMLNLARNVNVMHQSICSRAQVRPQGLELFGKTLGVIGAGRIGQGVARRCRGFNMRILVNDLYRDEAFAKETGAEYVSLEEVLKNSDFITLHAPLTEKTKNMISKREFEMMKPEAVLVNTARGGVVDEEALYEALKSGRIWGAALDAMLSEPAHDSPLTELPNCILTPHAGAATKEASSRMSLIAAENVAEVLGGGISRFNVIRSLAG